jgi:hypothetical protein
MDDTHIPEFLQGAAMILANLVRLDWRKEAANIASPKVRRPFK